MKPINTGMCITCGKSTRRKPNPRRPCCRTCEKIAPMAIQAPGCFLDRPSPAHQVARAAIAAAEGLG